MTYGCGILLLLLISKGLPLTTYMETLLIERETLLVWLDVEKLPSELLGTNSDASEEWLLLDWLLLEVEASYINAKHL